MHFASEAQKSCFDKVVGYAKELFGDRFSVADGVPLIQVPLGSAVSLVSVLPLDKDDAVVSTRAIVVSGAQVTPELTLFLLQANTSMVFGHFGLTPHGDVVLEHNLIGSTLDREELRKAIITVARVADDVDDEIVARWGGERALDKVDSLARLMEFEPVGTVSH